MTIYDVRVAAHSDKPSENDNLTLQLPSALCSVASLPLHLCHFQPQQAAVSIVLKEN